MHKYYEFFAGGGMVRAGLSDTWQCLFANDIDLKKGQSYRTNWGTDELKIADVKAIVSTDLPEVPDAVWASFPCQDLSLAGNGAGLRGERSGTFWPFWNLMKTLISEKRAPRIIALENVCGTITSHGGSDFAAICSAFREADYQYGAFVVDAALFVPQSRPRLFVIGVRQDVAIAEELFSNRPTLPWHTRALQNAVENLDDATRENWVWWNLPLPAPRAFHIADIIEDEPQGVVWHTEDETCALLAKMSDVHLEKIKQAKQARRRVVGAIYKRTRFDVNGLKVQRAEVRFDDTAGCLRTPGGGSSRQVIITVEKGRIRSRLISSRETARLMGLPETYALPQNYNDAYHLTGDGVVVPVVRYLAKHLFEPILNATQTRRVKPSRERVSVHKGKRESLTLFSMV